MADIYHDYTRKLEGSPKTEDLVDSVGDPRMEQDKLFDNFTVPSNNASDTIRNAFYGIDDNKEQYFISSDHCYARPWNWKPEQSFLRPTKTLFFSKSVKTNFPGQLVLAEDDVSADIDIETIDNEPPPIYNVVKANELMEECESHIKSFQELFKGVEENHLWEDAIVKHNWTQTQTRLFNGMVNILHKHQLGKLAFTGMNYEAIRRRTAIDKSVQRMRRLMATVFWDQKLTQWLHVLLLENLSAEYMSIYLDILQTLKAKLPFFVEKMMFTHNTQRNSGTVSTENLVPMMKRPWDPVISSLILDRPKKLPGNCLIVVIPSSPITSDRYLKWINLLSNLAMVVSVPMNLGTPGPRLTTMHCVDQMFASVRGQIQDVKNENPDKSLILIGFNAGAALALQIAQAEQVLAVICLGFSSLTAEGKRGEAEDSLMELQSPVLFVIGQCSTTSSQEDMEELRERMRVETGLVIVGSADNYLRISKKKKRAEGITQCIVDRCIMDEIGEFVSGIILSPYPPQLRQSPTPIVSDSTITKKTKSERKRYNSNTSSLDSEDLMSPLPAKISRPVGRPPGSKTKSRLEVKWAAQVAQGTSSQIPTSPSPNSTSPLTPSHFDSSSNDSFLDKNSDRVPNNFPSKIKTISPSSTETPRPMKKVRTLKPVLPCASSDKTANNNIVLSSTNKGFPNKGSVGYGPAKMQAYGLAKNSVVPGSRLSSLLQGGLKTIPPSQPKSSGPIIKVLENVTITPGNAKVFPNSLSKAVSLVNTMGGIKQTGGNVIILPDGKMRTVGAPNISRGPKYITSKKQLMGNKPPKSVKKFMPHKPPTITTNLPPPTNLTTQDIMDLPIIFADDNQIIDTPLQTSTSPQAPQQSTQIASAVPKIIAPGSKFVVVNRPINVNSNNSNFVISQTPIKKSATNIYRQTPKYTKIILSKRAPADESSNSQALSRIANLSSEISVKKVNAPISSTIHMQNFDLENELVATTIPKPSYSSEFRNLPIMTQKLLSKKNEIYSKTLDKMKDEVVRVSSPNNNDDDDSDPDYIPPKMVKMN